MIGTRAHELDLRSPAERIATCVRALYRRWPLVVLSVAAAFASAGLYLSRAAPEYEASALILLQPSDAVAAVINQRANQSPANAQRDLDTDAGLAISTPVADQVRRLLGLTETSAALLSRVALAGQQQSNLVKITVRDTSSARAAQIATTFGRVASTFRASVVRNQIQAAIDAGRASLPGLDAVDRVAVKSRLLDPAAAQAVQTGGMRLIAPAAVPAAAVSTHAPLVLAATLVLALALAVLVVLLAERLDGRLRDAKDVADAFDSSVLGAIPLAPRSRGDAAADLAALLIADGQASGGRVLLFADASATPLASDVAELACAHLASSGRHAILIETTPRGPATPTAGCSDLTRVLCDGAPLSRALQRVCLDDPSGPAMPRTYRVVAFGATDLANRGALLVRPELESVLDHARKLADVVVVAGAGVMPPRGFAPLMQACDALVLVVEARRTPAGNADLAGAAMGRGAGKLAGIVMADGGRWLAPRRGRQSAPTRGALAQAIGDRAA